MTAINYIFLMAFIAATLAMPPWKLKSRDKEIYRYTAETNLGKADIACELPKNFFDHSKTMEGTCKAYIGRKEYAFANIDNKAKFNYMDVEGEPSDQDIEIKHLKVKDPKNGRKGLGRSLYAAICDIAERNIGEGYGVAHEPITDRGMDFMSKIYGQDFGCVREGTAKDLKEKSKLIFKGKESQ